MHKSTRETGAIWAGVTIIAIAIPPLVWSLISESACRVASDIQQGMPASPCLEFWFNRYQAIIGAGVTLLAAYIAWHAVQVQLRSYDEQAWQVAKRSSDAIIAATNKLIGCLDELAVVHDRDDGRDPFNGSDAPAPANHFREINIKLFNSSRPVATSEIEKIDQLLSGCRPLMRIQLGELILAYKEIDTRFRAVELEMQSLSIYTASMGIPGAKAEKLRSNLVSARDAALKVLRQ